ncbi:MAG: hypothetical protein KDD21_10980 [Bacteroidetes bacterium]|nr:hypothetical protein [Bacteroidota bacterium]
MNKLLKFASYFFDIPLKKVHSQYSDEVQVSVHLGQYKLSTKNAIYSFGKKYTSFETAIQQIKSKQRIQQVLVLGFGLGSVVDLLENHINIKKIVAVDADKIILQLAQRYSQAKLKNKVNYVCDDAIHFIQNNTSVFDLVLVDLFIDDKTPKQFLETSFLNQLKKSVAQNGILIFSKLDDSQENKNENALFENHFSNIFNESYAIETDGNKLFIWKNN